MEIRRAGTRFVTRAEGRETRHSFSFGTHYDPDNVSFGALVAHNEEALPPGTGYSEHPHVGVEIVTVVLSGRLRHSSDVGSGLVEAGGVQRLTSGPGVTHSEVGAPGCRFVQTWLAAPAVPQPSYAAVASVPGDGLVALAGGDGPLALTADARLFRVSGDTDLALPGMWAHVFVVSGTVAVEEDVLGTGDALRVTEPGTSVRVTGTSLIWTST